MMTAQVLRDMLSLIADSGAALMHSDTLYKIPVPPNYINHTSLVDPFVSWRDVFHFSCNPPLLQLLSRS